MREGAIVNRLKATPITLFELLPDRTGFAVNVRLRNDASAMNLVLDSNTVLWIRSCYSIPLDIGARVLSLWPRCGPKCRSRIGGGWAEKQMRFLRLTSAGRYGEWPLRVEGQNPRKDFLIMWDGLKRFVQSLWPAMVAAARGLYNGLVWLCRSFFSGVLATARAAWGCLIWLCDVFWSATVAIGNGLWGGVKWLGRLAWQVVIAIRNFLMLFCTFSFAEILIPVLPWGMDYGLKLFFSPPLPEPAFLNQKLAVSAMMYPLAAWIRVDSTLKANPASLSPDLSRFLGGTRNLFVVGAVCGGVLYASSIIWPATYPKHERTCYVACVCALAAVIVLSFINFMRIRLNK